MRIHSQTKPRLPPRAPLDRGLCFRFLPLSRSPIISHQNTVVKPLTQKSSFALEFVSLPLCVHSVCRSASANARNTKTPQTRGFCRVRLCARQRARASLGVHKLHRKNPPQTLAPWSCKRGTLRAAFSKSAQTFPPKCTGI